MPRPANSALATLSVLQDLRQDIDNALHRNEQQNKQLNDALRSAHKQMESCFFKQYLTRKSKTQSFETKVEQKLKHSDSLQPLNKPPKEFLSSKHSLYIDLSRHATASTSMTKNLASMHRLDDNTDEIESQTVSTAQQSNVAVDEISSMSIPGSTRAWRASLASVGGSLSYCVPSTIQPALGGSSKETAGPSNTPIISPAAGGREPLCTTW